MPTTRQATGPFDVKLQPQPAQSPTPAGLPGHVLLDKRYHGDLDATAQGQMLSAGTATPGSAAYVAIEHIVGTLHGRAGSFVLQHTGLMNRGAPTLTIIVVPDSGTGELLGLTGRMDIRIADGKHDYTLDYALP